MSLGVERIVSFTISDLRDSGLPDHTSYRNFPHISVVTFGLSSISKNLRRKRTSVRPSRVRNPIFLTYQPRSQIQLTFDDKPKNLDKGFVFGSDPQICDVFLGERVAGFSAQKFCITFNERGEVIFVKEPAKEPELSEFIEITDVPVPVIVRRSGFRINATHIAKLSGRSRRTVRDLRKWLGSEKYTIVRGSKKHQGTYVDFDIGIEQSQEYGLPELEKRLHSLRRTLEGPVSEAEPSHVEPRLPVSDTVSARNESFESRGIWNRDPPPTLPGGSIPDGPIEVEDADETDSGSDVAGSGDSVTSREPCPIQRNAQPAPSIRCAKDATSSRPLGRNTRSSLLKLVDPHSPSAKSVQYEAFSPPQPSCPDQHREGPSC